MPLVNYNSARYEDSARPMDISQTPASTVFARSTGYEQPSEDTQYTRPSIKIETSSNSENGPGATPIQPLAKHSGSSVAIFFNGLFTTIIALATLGTSITFSFVLSNQTTPPPDGARYDANTVQFFLSLSWLLFLLALAIAATGSTLLTFFRKHWVYDWDGERGKHSQLAVQLYAVAVSALMGGLIIAAFVFMCLVIVAYQPTVGWISTGFTSLFGVIVVVALSKQVPWPWKQKSTRTLSLDGKNNFA